MTDYYKGEYWDKKYKSQERTFEWYCRYDSIGPALAKYISDKVRFTFVLHSFSLLTVKFED